jgi:DNA repair protein RadC
LSYARAELLNQTMAKDDRPREKLLMKGAESLSDSELLAILIGNGTRSKTAIDLAKEILVLGKKQSACS